MSDFDLAVALSLQDLDAQYHEKPVTVVQSEVAGIVDEHWELTDPNPNIHQLFVHFDGQFFWGKLVASGVAVAWSNRMTLCAGVCSYEGRGGLCSIRLSQPLLKLRPRKDLVETLLHEMIHAFLFVTQNNRDHDAHGPHFLSHMERINKATGAKISVYHSFHREVREYRQHWWKCDGPCQKKPPYFGMVKRAMNRPPSPRDPWWLRHQESCGGVFRKIKEPQGYGKSTGKGRGDDSKGKRKTSDNKGKGKAGNRDIRELLKEKGGSKEEFFKGCGFVVGNPDGGESNGDLRSKMLIAAEKRKAENTILRDITVGGKRKVSSDGCSSRDINDRKRICVENSTEECVIILDDGGDTESASHDSHTSSPEESMQDVETYKTCPVCEMANIPSAIINLHVSLCLEAEEQFRIIIDDDDD